MSGLYQQITIPAVLNPGSINSLNEQLQAAEKAGTRFIVLTGSEGMFCNGLDLAWVANSEHGANYKDMESYATFLKQLQQGTYITIALVNGVVSGGGMGIVCACDHVIATPESTFSLPEGLLGLIPGMILPSLLNRLTPHLVKKMVLTGKKYPAVQALSWNVADELTAANDMEAALTACINAFRACKPGAVKDIKEILYTSHVSKDELATLGMNVLNARLQEPDIRQRLKDISDFM